MKINDVRITNWKPPGGPFWDEVQERSLEPLIEATIKMTLSWDECDELMRRDKNVEGFNANRIPV